MRFVHSLFLFFLTLCATTFLQAAPASKESPLTIVCATVEGDSSTTSGMGTATFYPNNKLSPNTAAIMVADAINRTDLPAVKCSSNLGVYKDLAGIDTSATTADSATLDKFAPLMEALERAELRARLLHTTNGTPFTYRYLTASEVKSVAQRTAELATSNPEADEPVARNGATDVMSKNIGILVTVPAIVLVTTGYPDVALYYIGALAGGVALNHAGVWNTASIMLANTIALTAYVGTLYAAHQDEEFDKTWLSEDYAPIAEQVKALFDSMKGTDPALIPTTLWGVISAKLALPRSILSNLSFPDHRRIQTLFL